ncbi:MAG TPA: hypothetical protein VFQ79_02680 [Bryobacteraceae bacterium]|nr:hypothetical protein [Bryobacteraceae bacterium]
MNNSRLAFVQAIRGPILLIALGVLFIVDHAGGPPFRQTWPVLIILFGLLKLLERAVIRQPAPVPSSPPERLS